MVETWGTAPQSRPIVDNFNDVGIFISQWHHNVKRKIHINTSSGGHMLSFKEFISEEQTWKFTHHLFRDGLDPDFPSKTIKSKTRPSVTQIAKLWGGANGKNDGQYHAGAGRCFEFADQIHWSMKQAGYKGHRIMTSKEWARKGKGNTPEFTERLHDEMSSSHAWIYHKGKHYDSMNPEGVDHPSKLKFYR